MFCFYDFLIDPLHLRLLKSKKSNIVSKCFNMGIEKKLLLEMKSYIVYFSEFQIVPFV